MKILLGAILILGLQAAEPPRSGPPPDDERKLSARAEKRIISLIRKAVSKDEAAARQAQAELVEIGPAAVPLLQQALREERDRSYSILYVLDRIYQEDAGKDWEDIPAGADRRGRGAEEYLRSRFEDAKRLHEEGKHALALRILEAIQVLEPRIEFERELETYLERVKAAVYQSSVLSVAFETEKEAYEVGEVIRVTVRMENPGKETIVIPLAEDAQNFGSVGLERRVYSPLGTWERERQDIVLTLSEGIELPPGGSYTRPFLIDTRELELGRGGYAAVRVSGRLRPPSLFRGEENLARLVEVPPIDIPLLAKGQGALAEDPVDGLEKLLEADRRLEEARARAEKAAGGEDEAAAAALAEASEKIDALSRDLFPLAFLSARKGLWATNRRLIGALEAASPAGARSAMTALSLLNGKNLALEKGQWMIWWFRVNE